MSKAKCQALNVKMIVRASELFGCDLPLMKTPALARVDKAIVK